MGLRNNTISGFLPSAQAFAIHYPGYPSSMSRAIDTLGGTQTILKVHGSHSNKLELRFRLDDPYSHPTYGELRSHNCFLFKIWMVDYQHVVAVHADATCRKKRNWTEMQESCLDKANLVNVDKEDVMILVPPLFAIKDAPESLVLKSPAMFSLKRKQEIVHNPYKVDVEPVLAIDFNIKDIPKTVNWEEYIPHGSEQWHFQISVSKLFEERPIWPKESLIERLLDNGSYFRAELIRRLLSRIAYYFSRGPFQRFWIKKGYDPRRDRDSRIYQRIDFRVPQSLRSYCNANASNKLTLRYGEITAFQVFPHKFHTSLQLFELEDEYIQEEIRKPTEETSCSFETGWFSQRVLNCLRQRVMMRFLSVFPIAGAEALLKAATENFEKYKMSYKKDGLKIDPGGDQQTCAVVINEDKLEVNYVEEDEGDDLAVENDDEEFDMVGDDDEISLESHSYLNVNDASRTHLQELFGSFPYFNEDGEKMDDVDASEEEYQIYEQDSDANDSDDYDS